MSAHDRRIGPIAREVPGVPPASPPGDPPARWPWLIVATFLVVAASGTWLVALNDESVGAQVPYVIAFGMFGVVGAVILSRASGNRVGALLLYGSTITAISFVGGEVVTFFVRRGTTTGVAVIAVGVVSNVGWIVGVLPVVLLLPQIFPDGRLLSPRWRWLAGLTLVALFTLGFGSVLSSRTLTGSVDSVRIANPLFVPVLARLSVSDAIASVGLLGCLVGSVVSLVVRFRRSLGVQRQQIKWVVASLLLLVASFAISTIVDVLHLQSFFVDTVLNAAAFLSIPASIGIAILQYRLFDLDVVVKRAVVAATLVLLVIGVYAAAVWVVGAFAAGERSSGTVFVIALLLGIAFRPVARFARRIADRLVYGRRATPYEVLTEFSERVGDAYATDDVLARMARILGQGVGANAAGIWLFVGHELREASRWPADTSSADPIAVVADEVGEAFDGSFVPVRDRGELLGALSVSMSASDPMTPAKAKLVRDLAAQAGLVLRNVRLVEELKASQRRIVAAQDAERRRIERNIHDGAQQQLVALAVRARLARSLVGRDDDKTSELLDQIGAETQEALEDLRDLARGIYPPLLADKGLPAALEAQARKAPMPVEVSPDGVGRYDQPVEAAVYFSVLEALQNAAKYAEASTVRVRLSQGNGDLTFEVTDDGRGFDSATTSYGTGLQGMTDRLHALDGTLEIRSAPGAGTSVLGSVPIRP
jgi:signal transduction histidine kinase